MRKRKPPIKEDYVTACHMCDRFKKRPVLRDDGYYYHGKTRCENKHQVSAERLATRKKCKVEMIECVYVDFTGAGAKNNYIGKDDEVVHKFMRWCLDNDILGVRGPGGTCGPGVYAYCHQNRHKRLIIEFFESEGIDVVVYTS